MGDFIGSMWDRSVYLTVVLGLFAAVAALWVIATVLRWMVDAAQYFGDGWVGYHSQERLAQRKARQMDKIEAKIRRNSQRINDQAKRSSKAP